MTTSWKPWVGCKKLPTAQSTFHQLTRCRVVFVKRFFLGGQKLTFWHYIAEFWKLNQFGQKNVLPFSFGPALRPGWVIILMCLFVCLFVCLSACPPPPEVTNNAKVNYNSKVNHNLTVNHNSKVNHISKFNHI